jgi:ABC-2 type transport system permease protein
MIESEEALAAGAEARGIYEDVYMMYLSMRLMNYVSDGLYAITGMSIAELQANPDEILENEEVIEFIARVFGFTQEEIDELLEYGMSGADEYAYDEYGYGYEYEEEPAATQEMLMVGITAAADYLNMSMTEIMAQIGLVRQNPNALAVAVYESGGTEQEVINFVNQMWDMNELALDEGMQFSVVDFLSLNLGAFLLMFAIGSITFLASCIFNLSKNALIIGAGLPVGFLILEMLSQISEDFEMLRYLSLNTLFDTSAISSGGTFIPQFIVLAVIGAVLYAVGLKVFKEKDLPL